MPTDDLQQQLAQAVKEVQFLRDQMLSRDLESVRNRVSIIEARIKPLEEAVTKFNFIMYLTMGGGLVGLINLGLLAFTLLNALSKNP